MGARRLATHARGCEPLIKKTLKQYTTPTPGPSQAAQKTTVGAKEGVALLYRRFRGQADVCHGMAPIPHLSRAQYIIPELLGIHASIYPNSPRDL